MCVSVECGKITVNNILYILCWLLVPTCLNTQHIYLHFINIQIIWTNRRRRTLLCAVRIWDLVKSFRIFYFIFAELFSLSLSWFLHVPFGLNKIKYKNQHSGGWFIGDWYPSVYCRKREKKKFCFFRREQSRKGF